MLTLRKLSHLPRIGEKIEIGPHRGEITAVVPRGAEALEIAFLTDDGHDGNAWFDWFDGSWECDGWEVDDHTNDWEANEATDDRRRE